MSDTAQMQSGRHGTSTSGWAPGHRTTSGCASGCAGCDEWDEFEATSLARPILDGLGNEDEFRTDYAGGFVGMSFRFFDPVTRRVVDLLGRFARRSACSSRPWSAASRATSACSKGRTRSRAGRSRALRVVGRRHPAPRWEQAFSDDGGAHLGDELDQDFTRREASAMSTVDTESRIPADYRHVAKLAVPAEPVQIGAADPQVVRRGPATAPVPDGSARSRAMARRRRRGGRARAWPTTSAS